MAGGEPSAAATVVPTIWEALEAWCGQLAPWQQCVLGLATAKGRLNSADIDAAYVHFLNDTKLRVASDALTVPTITRRPTDALSQTLALRRVDGIQGVNRLQSDAALTFGPALTVIYGRNGAGKSGFARLLSNACFSRQCPEILPDIYAQGDTPAPSATFHLALGEADALPLTFSSASENTALKRITVFDSAVAQHHISQSAAFEFKPIGFDVFPEMSRAYSELLAKLDGEIGQRTRPNTFTQSFIGGTVPTDVHTAVAGLGAATDIEQLRTLGTYGATESARLDELDRQILALRTKSPKEVLAARRDARADVSGLRNALAGLLQEFTDEAIAARVVLVNGARESAAVARTMGSDRFRKPFFQAVGTSEWEAFAAQAHSLAKREGEGYPAETDHCLLCERPLDAASSAHITELLAFVESDARQTASDARRKASVEAARLRALDLNVFAPTTKVRSHVRTISPEMEGKLEGLFTDLKSRRDGAAAGIDDLTLSTTSGLETLIPAELDQLLETIAADITRLEADDTDASLASLNQEWRLLRHRHVLSQNLAAIEVYVDDCKWVVAAGGVRAQLNTAHITLKEKELFGQLVGETYKERLSAECDRLNCKVPVEMQTIGRSGQTIRSLAMPGGHKPHTILSEGEQKAVALADFLTEVGQNSASAGIVLDDPVTSQDHDRKERIAHRLVEEAKRRQVIIFTHDLVFLNQLAEAAKERGVDLEGHWVDRDNDQRPGKVTLGDSPATARVHETTQKAKEALAEAQALSGSPREDAIRRGMGALRRTLEETVVRRLLKNVVPRWSDRVMVTTLPRINWDYEKIKEISKLYEDLSRYIEGHSHTDEATGAPPEADKLATYIEQVEELIRWARTERSGV